MTPPTSLTSRYESLVLLGTGGMATVHVGRLRGADGFSRLVALKRAHAHVKQDESLANSMRKEARLASRLHHTNVVSILDVEDDEGDLVLVLDYVEGCTLSTLLAKMNGPHPREMVRVILDVAAGLHAAHGATDEAGKLLGLVHRDVSPSNVLLGTDGLARVSDFGIAKAQFEDRDRTETGLLKGKASYMAPEYVLHQRADPASDLFSMGIVAWEALTGTRLFKGATEIDTLNRIVSATVHPMAQHDRALAPLDEVVLRALERLPEDRQASVDEFAAELAEVARRHDLLGSHHEVSELVELVASKDLEDLRRDLARTAQSYVGTVPSVVPRDDIDTKTLQKGVEEPTHTDETTAPIVVERASAVPPSVTRMSAGAPPSSAPAPSAPPLPPAATFRRDDKPGPTGREKLGLAAALGLLVLALLGLAVRMRDDDVVVRAPAVPAPSDEPAESPSAPPSSSSVTALADEPATNPDDAPLLELDASSPRPISRPVHKRTYPAATPALMPRKAPPNPYAPVPK